jgi:hypothetical protein
MLKGIAVDVVYAFDVEGSAGPMPATGGIFLGPVRGEIVTTPAKPAKGKDAAADCEAEDSCEELGHPHLPSDLEDEVQAVDTDQASLDESGNTTESEDNESSEDDPDPATADKESLKPATGGKKKSIFDNGYFYLLCHPKQGTGTLRMYIH